MRRLIRAGDGNSGEHQDNGGDHGSEDKGDE